MTDDSKTTNRATPADKQESYPKVSSYVDAETFEALESVEEGHAGTDWVQKVPADDWREHEERLRSVVDAQQEAEVLGTDVLIGS